MIAVIYLTYAIGFTITGVMLLYAYAIISWHRLLEQ